MFKFNPSDFFNLDLSKGTLELSRKEPVWLKSAHN